MCSFDDHRFIGEKLKDWGFSRVQEDEFKSFLDIVMFGLVVFCGVYLIFYMPDYQGCWLDLTSLQ